MDWRALGSVGAALMAACGGSVTTADHAGDGGRDAATGDDAGVNEAAPPGDGVDGAPAAPPDGVDGAPAAPPGDGVDGAPAAPPGDGVDGASACGTAGQACCGTSCNAGNVCVVIDGASQCEACGQPGQPCCTTVPACADAVDSCFGGSFGYCMNSGAGTLGQPGDQCTTTCADPTYTCVDNGMTSYCKACGGLGNACCGTTCAADLRCTAGTCQ